MFANETLMNNFFFKLLSYFFNRKVFIENNFPDTECRTYENLDALRMQVDNTDSASLRFESILENDISQVNDGGANTSNDAAGHGFLFDIQHENYDIPRINNNNNSIHSVAQQKQCANYENDDIERKKFEFSHKNPTNKNELTDNALFNKFREAADIGAASYIQDTIDEQTNVDTSSDELSEGKLKDSNSVSCEDLLEFADEKPKGKERGIESDEVRLMIKVLGKTVNEIYKFIMKLL